MNKEMAVKTAKKNLSIKAIAKIGVLAALAGIIMLFEFPLPFAPTFLKLDLSEIPVIIGAFALGPIAGVFIEFVKILLNFIFNGTITGGIGELANLLIGCAFVVPAALIYSKNKSIKTAVIGLGVGILCMTFMGSVLNYYLLVPVYAKVFGCEVSTIVAMGTAVNSNINSLWDLILLGIVPFNIVKGLISSGITLLVYKRVSYILHK